MKVLIPSDDGIKLTGLKETPKCHNKRKYLERGKLETITIIVKTRSRG